MSVAASPCRIRCGRTARDCQPGWWAVHRGGGWICWIRCFFWCWKKRFKAMGFWCFWLHQVFVYRRLGLRRAPKPLDGTLDREVQCTHYGHITPSESVKEWPLYDVMFPQICQAVKDVMALVTPELEDRCCVLLGMDFICDDRPYLLEINQVPRLCYDDPHVQAWTQRMALEFLRLVVLGSVETSTGWLRLWNSRTAPALYIDGGKTWTKNWTFWTISICCMLTKTMETMWNYIDLSWFIMIYQISGLTGTPIFAITRCRRPKTSGAICRNFRSMCWPTNIKECPNWGTSNWGTSNWGTSNWGTSNWGTICLVIFCGDIPLHRPCTWEVPSGND